MALDGEWKFTYSSESGEGKIPNIPKESAFTASINVPGYWDDHKDLLRTAHFWGAAKFALLSDSYIKFNPEYRPFEYPLGTKSPDASLPYICGTGYYRKAFSAPADWQDRTIVLVVGGVCQQAWVWLNGQFLTHHVGYETPFEIPLNEALKTGENELVIAVDNAQDIGHKGCDRRGYKGYSGGIYRPVYLVKVDN